MIFQINLAISNLRCNYNCKEALRDNMHEQKNHNEASLFSDVSKNVMLTSALSDFQMLLCRRSPRWETFSGSLHHN